MATDYTLDEDSVVIDLIRTQNPGQVLTSSLVTFGFPNVNVPSQQFPHDTLIVATAIPGRRYSGSQSFNYNRVPIAEFVDPRLPNQTTFVIANERTLADLLPVINERYDIRLTADKIINHSIPNFQDQGIAEFEVELEIAPNSKVYKDAMVIKLVPELIPLSAVIKNRHFDGLTYQPPA
jgi:hypothetical protein